MMEGTQQILAHPEECKGHFSTAALGGLQAATSPTSAASTTSSAGKRRRPTTATTARRCGTSWARRWPTRGPRHDAADQLADLDRSAVHRRADAAGAVGVRLAHDLRRDGGVRDQLPVTVLLDGRRVPALGLAVLLRGRGLPGQEGPAAAGRLLPRLFDAAAHLPGVRVHGADPGRAAAAVGDAQPGRSALEPGARARPRLEGRHGQVGTRTERRTVPELVWTPSPLQAAAVHDAARALPRIDGATCGCSAARRWRSGRWCRSAWRPATASAATRRSSSTPRSTRRRRSPTTWGCAR